MGNNSNCCHSDSSNGTAEVVNTECRPGNSGMDTSTPERKQYLQETSVSLKEFTITLEKRPSQDKIGADVARALDFLVILKVKPGLIHEHNKSHPDQMVLPNDQIMAANDLWGDSKQILKVISAEHILRLTIRRPSPKEQ
eukprot:CAMPEP_0175704688 /NCGR_PEP_ID=MMETSP0097-20121207/37150_1 /TAXON_ID=311494 /ORGANISM="Alexandrium monilatum, Strain CCMP3105" /LENGTH=139 /DNA_ID=CAMNT_0017011993 /DNA_START=14 /DNA_END=433 /DNA_ORIENTATION=-